MKVIESPSSPRSDRVFERNSADPQPYRRLFAAVAIAGLASALVSPAAGAIAYNQSITAIYGGGNPNGGWASDTANGITLGLRGKHRSTGDTTNISGVYSYAVGATGTVTSPRAYWNWDFSINSGAVSLDTYDYFVAIDTNPSQGISFVVVDALAFWNDNSYGTAGTLNGAGVEGPASTYAASNTIAQQSQNLVFAPSLGNPFLNATYHYELFAVAKGAGPSGSRLASVRITVVVGTGGAPSPDLAAPAVANIQPTIVPVGAPFAVKAIVDDLTTGGSAISSAAYAIDGVPAGAMTAADGNFDESNEDVQAAAPGLPVGVYNLSVSGTDAAGNIGSATTLLAVYDPSAGFVTGGGWVNSPAGAFTGPNSLQLLWNQDFSTGTAGWLDSNSGWYGQITALGDGTARVEGDGSSAPFSRFDGYHSTWPGTWIAEIDVYLDPTWASGTGFDYSVAANGTDGLHQRDYIFHVGVVENYGPVAGKAMLVNASNNADFTTNPYKLVNDNGGNFHAVTTAGWYTLQHVFSDAGGYLSVNLNLLDSNGTVVWSATRSNAADTIPIEVGGNRYGWFTHIDVPGGVLVDNHQRFENGPTYPTGRANFGFVSKYKKGATVPEGSTEFVFNAGGLNFHSSAYEWLVVNQNGTNAQFKGTGRINGAGNYGFMIWASDNGNGGSTDTFRIQIVDKDDGDATVYDNGVQQPLGGGNIMIQTKK